MPAKGAVTEAEEAAAKAVSLAREVIDKYGADADKPSVKLAIALINGAHERDALALNRDACAESRRAIIEMWEDAKAALAKVQKLLPGCLGEWVGGSGGHRKYAGGCKSPGVWNVGMGFVCDQHKNANGGDDDAWTWESERELLMSLASPDQDGLERVVEQLLLMTSARNDALRQRDNVLRISEAALESANQHALNEYARGVADGSEINVNILEESKADLEEQRQEIGRLQMQIKEMQEH